MDTLTKDIERYGHISGGKLIESYKSNRCDHRLKT